MKNPQLQQQIKDLIRQGNTAEVFNLLNRERLSPNQTKTLAIIEAAYHELRQTELKGLATADELQIRKNKINNQLLELLEEKNIALSADHKSKTKYLALIVIAVLGICILLWYFVYHNEKECPSYPADINNKILILPFENVGDAPAKPQVSIYKRINELAAKNKLSAFAQLAELDYENLSSQTVLSLGEACDLDLLIWGTYSSRSDSIRLVMEYYFSKAPENQVLSQLVTLKDVTGLQKGTMLKTLDDAVFSLCGVIALREGNTQLAKEWFGKVAGKEAMDREVINALE